MAKKETTDFVNPFTEGVTYDKFLSALGETPIKEYLKDACTDEEIKWIETEIKNYKNNKLN